MSIQQAYNRWSESYDRDRNLTRDLDQAITREALAGKRFQSILELGCGTGKNTLFLAEIGAAVHALDFSAGMIQKAREKVRAENVRFSMADLTQTWPAEDRAYDLIICNLVLEHIEDLGFIFAEAKRVLDAKGTFLVNELHPFRQYEGKKAQFTSDAGLTEVAAFTHHISDFLKAAAQTGFNLVRLEERWHEEDEGKPPRILSLLFERNEMIL